MNKFARVYILGLGFLSGLFIGIGVDPEAELIKALLEIVAQYSLGLVAVAMSLSICPGSRCGFESRTGVTCAILKPLPLFLVFYYISGSVKVTVRQKFA